MEIKPDDILKAVGFLGAGIGWLIQSRAKLQREKIKLDLEILEKAKTQFGETDERTRRVAAKVTMLMFYLYRDIEPTSPRFQSWADLALAVACFIGAGSFIWSWSSSGNFWYVLGGGITGFVGLGALLNAFGKGVPRDSA